LGRKFEVKGSKVEVTVNENVKVVLHTYFRQKWISLRQTKTNMIIGPFYTYCWTDFISGNALSFW